MVFSTRTVVEKTQVQLSIAEVYNLWDLLAGYYQATEDLKMYEKYAHDSDLVMIIQNTIDQAEKRIGD